MLHRQLTSPFFFFNDTATTEIYTLSLHDALPISSLVAPRESVGTLGGIVNFCNHLAGIAAPIVTGYIVKATNSFSGAFLAAAGFLLIGIAGYVFLLGRIEAIPEPA